jgi:hypothetical protein
LRTVRHGLHEAPINPGAAAADQVGAMTSSTASRRIDAAHCTGALLVEQCDIPAEMTISEWRVACAAEERAAASQRRLARGGFLRRALRRA